jgi:GntR family transcriptional regulator
VTQIVKPQPLVEAGLNDGRLVLPAVEVPTSQRQPLRRREHESIRRRVSPDVLAKHPARNRGRPIDRLAPVLVEPMIRRAIHAGEFTPGMKLPGEAEMIERYGVARSTVRLAIQLLKEDGLIETAHGRGSFVAQSPQPQPVRFRASESHSRERRLSTATDVHQADLAELGRRGQHTLQVEEIDPTPAIAARLELDDGSAVIVRRRVHVVDDEPSYIGDTYYPAQLVRESEIAKPEVIERGGNRVLAELGHEVVRRHDEISTRLPTPQEAQALMIASGVPVLATLATGYDAKDRPVAVYDQVRPGDRHVLEYDVSNV